MMVKALIGALVAVFIMLQLKLWSGDGGVIEVMALKKQVQEQTDLVESLKVRNVVLEAEVIDLKNRLGALEERARTDLGMIKDGETFFQDAS